MIRGKRDEFGCGWTLPRADRLWIAGAVAGDSESNVGVRVALSKRPNAVLGLPVAPSPESRFELTEPVPVKVVDILKRVISLVEQI